MLTVSSFVNVTAFFRLFIKHCRYPKIQSYSVHTHRFYDESREERKKTTGIMNVCPSRAHRSYLKCLLIFLRR